MQKKDTALDLAQQYKSCANNGKEFLASRHTCGSFVIIDKSQNVIITGRDRTIASHLYHYNKGNEHLFTTDWFQLLQRTKILDAVALDLMLMHNNKVIASFPLLKDCKSILPGYQIVLDATGIKELMFHRIKHTEVPDNYNEAVIKYGELLTESIHDSIGQDQHTAVFLSGGSDSAALVGALSKLGVKNVDATHIYYKGNFDFEHEDCELLQKTYGFNLRNTNNDQYSPQWHAMVKKVLVEASPNAFDFSIPSYFLMGDILKESVPIGTTAMSGELCLLDAGFSESNDPSRNFRRQLYRGFGHNLPYLFKILPSSCAINLEKHRYQSIYNMSKIERVMMYLRFIYSSLYAIGRPDYFYCGMKLGVLGGKLPVPNLSKSLLPDGFESNVWKRFQDDFFSYIMITASNMITGTMLSTAC